jgi:hypothetical protein
MPTRISLGILSVIGLVWAWQDHNLAAAYVAIVGFAVMYMLAVIELKLNRLLQHHGVIIPPTDIAEG